MAEQSQSAPEQTKKVLEDLIERFSRNLDAYKSPTYKEDQCRIEFINPFFESLGWDMANKQGFAEQYKEVVHEDTLNMSGLTKAPDYSFRIGGTRKFFLEAKKPAVSIKTDASPAHQLRRYAWSAKLPLSILTDFEEFAVYDCRIKPNEKDKPDAARVRYLTYEQYFDELNWIYATFSKEAILKGSFDRFAESSKGKKGTSEVDAEFLKEIESWRVALAKNIALRNPALNVHQLNDAVQRTIDRIIFLRMAEDRGIENYQQLFGAINGANIYKRLIELFYQSEDKYNSGLFDFKKDSFTTSLKIDDQALADIISDLYYPKCPYEFSVLGADTLGNIYEQFLGKVIRLTAGHQAKIEEKPEVKKAGGVYYTPKYIVDYIVQNTVGKLIENVGAQQAATGVPNDIVGASRLGGTVPGAPKDVAGVASEIVGARRAVPLKPDQISKIKILDPACGSGSFLLGAYQYLLDYHTKWYSEHYAELGKKALEAIYQGPRGQWLLTTSEKKRILLNNIFGVDIDPQAVEVTKLSLLLKVLENESEESLKKQLQLFHERALPDLDNNIKCGNSLIGTDFYKSQQIDLFDEEQKYKVNAFDWEVEFNDIFKKGGFDAIIGNPPYIRVRIFKELYPEEIEYLESKFQCATHVWDIYLLFFEQATRLTKKGAKFSFIVPIQTLHQPNNQSLRELLVKNESIKNIVDLSHLRVFKDAIVKNCILVCEKGHNKKNIIKTSLPLSLEQGLEQIYSSFPQEKVGENLGFSLKLDLLSEKKTLIDKMESKSWKLGDLCYVTFGLRSCAKGKGQGGKERLIVEQKKTAKDKPYLEGREIKRYATSPSGKFIKYIPEEMYSPRDPRLFETKKIISQSMLSKKRLIATLDDTGFYVEQSLVCIIPHGILTNISVPVDLPLEFLLGIINSTLESFYFSTNIIDFSLGGGLIHATPGSQERLIIPKCDQKEIDEIVSLVNLLLDLNKKVLKTKTPDEKTRLEREIQATDNQIDQLVYELYGLTEEEIRIVEG